MAASWALPALQPPLESSKSIILMCRNSFRFLSKIIESCNEGLG